MYDLQKLGGIAALVQAAAYIVGLGLALTFLAPVLNADPSEYVAFLASNQTLMYVWHLIIYVVAGVFLVFLVLALHERLKNAPPALIQPMTAFGLIWAALVIASGMLIINDQSVVAELHGQDPARATTIWLVLSTVERGLGGALELPGGLWILLLSWSALLTGGLPRALNYLGVMIGLAGILTVVPALYELGTVFGLGFIAWFMWAGIILLRSSARELQQPNAFVPNHGTTALSSLRPNRK